MRYKDNNKSTSEKMKSQIAVTKAVREALGKIFKVTERTVFNALSDKYSVDNGLHLRIRKAALEKGGTEMITLPMMRTFFDADNIMYNYLPNGAILEFYREDGTGHVFFKGQEVASYENVTVPMIYDIQEQAAALR